MILQQLQQQMMGYLLDSARGEESSSLPQLQAAVADNSPAVGLSIYAHAYQSRLVEVLRNDHEKLCLLIGRERFDALGAGYVVQHPSIYRSLRHFGYDFPDYLRASNMEDSALCAELCAFERLLLDVYDAANAPRLDFSALSALAPGEWPELKLQPHPGVRQFVDSTGAIPAWQRGNSADEQLVFEMPEQPVVWLVFRDRTRVCQFRALDELEALALQELIFGGRSLAACADALAQKVADEQVAQLLQTYLQRWFEDGLVQAFST